MNFEYEYVTFIILHYLLVSPWFSSWKNQILPPQAATHIKSCSKYLSSSQSTSPALQFLPPAKTNKSIVFFYVLFCPSSTNVSLILIMKQPNPAAAGSHTHQIMQYLSSSQSTSPALQFDEIFASWHTKLGGNSFVKYVHAYIYFEAQSFF